MKPKIYLSDNFTLAEATKSSDALRWGIDNTPNEQEIVKLKATAINILQPARDHFGIGFVPSSWFRCLLLNRELKSEDTSQHLLSEAVDWEIPTIDNLLLSHWVKDNLDFDQLILEYYTEDDPCSGWIHTSFVSLEANRHEILTFTKGSKVFGLPEL